MKGLRWKGVVLVLLLPLLLGCANYLVAGVEVDQFLGEESGYFQASFVSADGSIDLELPVAEGPVTVVLTATVSVQQGSLSLILPGEDEEPRLVLESADGKAQRETLTLQADEFGRIPYRVTARGARDGLYRLEYAVRR